MSESMFEKACRASYEATSRNKPFSLLTAEQRGKIWCEVRAVLEAIRDPDDAMVFAAGEHPGMCEPGDAEWVWGLMLSAILNGAK